MAKTDLTAEEILTDVNANLPSGIDWKLGAIEYLDSVKKNGLGADALLKPFWPLRPDSKHAAYEEVADLLGNFVNVFKLVDIPAGSRILDVACGTGWLAQFWSKLGYKTYGFDICPDFIELARQRFRDEPDIGIPIESRFQVHDIETGPLSLPEPMDVAVFESCFHHFYNPIAALRHVGSMLSDSGVAVLIEGGTEITAEFREVMVQYRTIERPYTRAQMKKILRAAGLPYFAFFAPVNQWIAQGYSAEHDLLSNVQSAFGLQNRCICAKTEAAIKRIVPDWRPDSPIEMGFGFYPGSNAGMWWCGPHAQMRIIDDCSIDLHFGPVGSNQIISIYSSRRGKIGAPKLSETRRLNLDGLRAGELLHICSEHAFSPIWSGGDDGRLLSFGLEVTLKDATQASLSRPQKKFFSNLLNQNRSFPLHVMAWHLKRLLRRLKY